MKARRVGGSGDLAGAGLRQGLVFHSPPVQSLNRPLVLQSQPGGDRGRDIQFGDELHCVMLVARESRVEPQLIAVRLEHLEAMVAGVADAVNANQALCLPCRSSGYAADQAVEAGQVVEKNDCPGVQRRLLGTLDDRRQCAIDVGEDGRPDRLCPQRLESGLHLPARRCSVNRRHGI